MKITGMEASNTAVSKPHDTKENSSSKINISKSVSIDKKSILTENRSTSIDGKNISQITDADKKELSISEKAIIDAIEKANKAIEGPSKRFEFSIHKKTHEIMVKVKDNETGEVIREFPPEKILDMVAKLWEMAGLVVDERR